MAGAIECPVYERHRLYKGATTSHKVALRRLLPKVVPMFLDESGPLLMIAKSRSMKTECGSVVELSPTTHP